MTGFFFFFEGMTRYEFDVMTRCKYYFGFDVVRMPHFKARYAIANGQLCFVCFLENAYYIDFMLITFFNPVYTLALPILAKSVLIDFVIEIFRENDVRVHYIRTRTGIKMIKMLLCAL